MAPFTGDIAHRGTRDPGAEVEAEAGGRAGLPRYATRAVRDSGSLAVRPVREDEIEELDEDLSAWDVCAPPSSPPRAASPSGRSPSGPSAFGTGSRTEPAAGARRVAEALGKRVVESPLGVAGAVRMTLGPPPRHVVPWRGVGPRPAAQRRGRASARGDLVGSAA